MEDLTTRAQLVDASEVDAQGVTATVPRSEIEDALASGEGPDDLILDVARFGDGEGTESRRLAVEWERGDLERLLRQTEGDRIVFAFDRRSLELAFDEPDVEPHGLREKALILTVAAATAAGAAGSAMAVPDAAGVGGSSGVAGYTAIESSRMAESAAADTGAAAASSGIEAARAANVADAGGAAAASSGIEAARATEAASEGGAAAASSGIEAARATEAASEGGIPSGYGEAVQEFRAAEGAADALAAGYSGIDTVGAEVAAELGTGQAAAASSGIEAARAAEAGTTEPREYGLPQPSAEDYLQSREYGLPQPTAADYVQTGDYGMPTAMPSDYEARSGDTGGGTFAVDAPSPAEAAALAGAAALAITGAAFAARSRRRLTPSS
jgi:hypothetical protein